MKKATLNYWVDMATGIAFLLVAATGIVRLLPEAASVSASGTPEILGIGSTVWTSVHDWSGVVMATGVAVHTVLHFRWLVHMTRKLAARSGRERVVREPARNRPTAEPGGLDVAAADMPAAAAAASLRRLREMPDAPVRDAGPRMNRKAFLAGTAAVGGAALLLGAGLLQRAQTSPQGNTQSASGRGSGGNGWGGSSTGTPSNEGTGTSSSSSSSGSESTSDSSATARVMVDAGACSGCGDCLRVCAQGVFALNGRIAVAQSPDSCSLCGRCLQVCRPGAITLNG